MDKGSAIAFSAGPTTLVRRSTLMIMRVVLVPVLLLLLASPSKLLTTNAKQTAVSGSQVQWQFFKPDQIAWRDGPSSLLPGAKIAVLEGDPTKEGFFTMRLKLPSGYR